VFFLSKDIYQKIPIGEEIVNDCYFKSKPLKNGSVEVDNLFAPWTSSFS